MPTASGINVWIPSDGGPYYIDIKESIINNYIIPTNAIAVETVSIPFLSKEDYNKVYEWTIVPKEVHTVDAGHLTDGSGYTITFNDLIYTGGGVSGTYNRPLFPINNRPQVNFLGSSLIEDLLIKEWKSFEQINYEPQNPPGFYDIWEQRGRVAGKVTLKNSTPIIRELRLYDRESGKLIESTWSDSNGDYQFTASVSITAPYYVVCLNEDSVDYNTLIHDWIIPDPV